MLTPQSEHQLAELISGQMQPLAIIGGGTRGIDGAGAGLSTSKLSGITTYEPGALTLVAKAGTPVAEIKAALDAENQMLAFEPVDHRVALKTEGEPTIGGVVATNSSGPRRVQAGACRDFLIGTRFVDGTGTVIKSGGRVMKNVTGYDLARLMCGAHGTLGVLTEVSLKVVPKPETEATLTIEGLEGARAVDAMSAALSTPYEISGAFYGAKAVGQSEAAQIRVEGAETSVKYRSQKLREVLAGFGAEISLVEHSASKVTWSGIKDITMVADATLVLRCHIAASRTNDFLDKLGHTGAIHMDWAGARLWISATDEQLVGTLQETDDPIQAAELFITRVRAGLGVGQGHCTVVKAHNVVRERVKTFQPENVHLAKMARALRQKYDPRSILNPGLMD